MYVHHRLTRCPHAQQRQDDARPEDLHHVGGLHVPQPFIDHILTEHMPTMQYLVAWHQYHMLMGVTQLRKNLTMPPRTMTEGIDPVEKRETPWYYKLNPHIVKPNPTIKKWWKQCFYINGQGTRKEPNSLLLRTHNGKKCMPR